MILGFDEDISYLCVIPGRFLILIWKILYFHLSYTTYLSIHLHNRTIPCLLTRMINCIKNINSVNLRQNSTPLDFINFRATTSFFVPFNN